MVNYFFLLRSYFQGNFVGADIFGNRYFCSKNNTKKRWVIYKGKQDPTSIPPQWHGWMHGYFDFPLDEPDYDYKSNDTGTDQAHNPEKTTYSHKEKMKIWKP